MEPQKQRKLPGIPAWMVNLNPHGHHIAPRTGGGAVGDAMRAMLKRNGITDHINDYDNLTVAPNGLRAHGQKATDSLQRTLDILREFDGAGDAVFRENLKRVGRLMLEESWWR